MLTWLDAQVIETLFISAILTAELRFGIAAMPPGKRHTILHDRVEGEVLPHFDGRILTFDLDTPQFYAKLMVGPSIRRGDRQG